MPSFHPNPWPHLLVELGVSFACIFVFVFLWRKILAFIGSKLGKKADQILNPKQKLYTGSYFLDWLIFAAVVAGCFLGIVFFLLHPRG